MLDQYLGLGIGGLGLATIVGLLLSQGGNISKVLGELKGINQRLETHEAWLRAGEQRILTLESCKDVPCPLHPGIVAAAKATAQDLRALGQEVHHHHAAVPLHNGHV